VQSKTKERIVSIKRARGYGLPFFLTLTYLALEYGRPQNTFPWVAVLHLPGISIGLLALMLIRSGKINLGEKASRLLIGFLVLMSFHIPFAVNNFWAYEMTRNMLITLIGYFAVVGFVDSFKKYEILIRTWIAIHIYLSVNGILMGGRGIGGFLGDENDFALALNMVIPFSFFLAMEAKRNGRRLLFITITGLFLVCVAVTFSRGGFLGLLAVGLCCGMRSRRKALSIVIMFLLASTLFCFAPKEYWQEIESIRTEASSSQRGTGQERIYSWRAAWRMFLDNPILGVGPGNFEWNFQKYEPPGGLYGRLHGGRAAHSLYFTLLPELGIIGTVLFLFILREIWKGRKEIMMAVESQKVRIRASLFNGEGKKTQKIYAEDADRIYYLSLALEASLVGYFVSGAFLSVLYYPNLWLLLGFAMALRSIAHSRNREVRELQTAGSRAVSPFPRNAPGNRRW
jgi:O-antigen ligase